MAERYVTRVRVRAEGVQESEDISARVAVQSPPGHAVATGGSQRRTCVEVRGATMGEVVVPGRGISMEEEHLILEPLKQLKATLHQMPNNILEFR
jgi:hypothetical protein